MTRIGVFGGVYANPYALRAMLADARARGCERLVCLGDLGGFGAEPDAVWPLLREAGAECIAGNYDLAIASGAADCGCGYADPRDNAFAQLMYDVTREATAPAFARWMGRLPGEWREVVGGVDLHMVHGSPLAINDFMWESLSDAELAERVRASGADVLCCTHTGIPWQREVAGCLVVNVGAVGRPANDGRTETWYAVLDLAGGRARAELVPVAYDWRAQAASMRRAGLPEEFVVTVETGWWATCLEVVPPRERARGRYHVYRDALAGWGAGAAAADADGLPAASLFGTPVFPARLWIYVTFTCNLACTYCAVDSSPRAPPRTLELPRVAGLADEAAAEGFAEIYLTGGEPFAHPEIVAMLEAASDRLPTTVLTNAMLLSGRRRRELGRLAGRPGLSFQVSLDGVRPETHDALRGHGSFARTIAGIRTLLDLGLAVVVTATETPGNAVELAGLGHFLAEIGLEPAAVAVRPLVARGASADGIAVDDRGLVPELTVSADGIHWHPVGADLRTSPDLLVAAGSPSLAEARRLIVERFLALRQADGTLPRAYRCAAPAPVSAAV